MSKVPDEIWLYVADKIVNNNENSKKLRARKGSVLNKFDKELEKMGFVIKKNYDDYWVCRNNPEITRPIVLKYYKKAIYKNEQEFLISCLYDKNDNRNKDLIPFFMKEIYKFKYIDDEHNAVPFEIGAFLEFVYDKKYVDEYIKLLKSDDKRVKEIKHYIIRVCGKIRDERFIEPLLSIIDEGYNARGVLDVLAKYRNPKLLPVFEKYASSDVKEVKRAAEKGIRYIKRKLEKEGK